MRSTPRRVTRVGSEWQRFLACANGRCGVTLGGVSPAVSTSLLTLTGGRPAPLARRDSGATLTRMLKRFALSAVVAAALVARAEIKTEVVEYQQGATTLEGFVAYDANVTGQRPVIVIVHQWMGLTDYEQKRAEMLAGLGYVAFCADIYGKGVRASNPG